MNVDPNAKSPGQSSALVSDLAEPPVSTLVEKLRQIARSFHEDSPKERQGEVLAQGCADTRAVHTRGAAGNPGAPP